MKSPSVYDDKCGFDEKNDIGNVQTIELMISDGGDSGSDIHDWFVEFFEVRDVNRGVVYSAGPKKYIGNTNGAPRSINYVVENGNLVLMQ